MYKIHLASPLQGQKSTRIQVKLAFANQLSPLPKEIKQGDLQKFLFTDNVYLYSTYRVSSQTLQLNVGNPSVDSWTQHYPSSIKGDSISYGPYKAQNPFTFHPIKVHFTNYKKLMSVTKLTRILEVSHWGNFAVEEHYELRNIGPSIKGPFSRLDYQRGGNQAHNSFNNIIAKLPKSASDIYYRDRIGNISTSTCRPSRDGKYLEFDINPRFPMFGGWKTMFYIGYNQPIHEVLSFSGTNFKLNTMIGTPFENTVVEKFTLKIILPEGSSNIKLEKPFEFLTETFETTKTYLDVQGRPTIILTLKNVVDEQSQAILQVNYTFTFLDQLRKPLFVIGLLFTFCLILMTYVRVDLTISKGEIQLKEEKLVTAHELVEKFTEKQISRLDTYRFLQKVISTKTAMEPSLKQAEQDRNEISNEIKKIINELKENNGDDFIKKIQEIEGLEKKKFEIIQQLSKAVGSNDEKKINKLEEEYDSISDEIDNILEDLKE